MATLITRVTLLFIAVVGGVIGEQKTESSKILYQMHTGKSASAIDHYLSLHQNGEPHDRELLQQMCLTLLDQGFRSEDLELQLLTLFGAGASLNERALYILEEGAHHKDPQIQLLSLNFLSRFQTEATETLLAKAMTSKYLPIRLEAIYHLAQKKHPQAVHQAESLMAKVPKPALPLFPQIFAASGTPHAMTIMQRLLTHVDPQVRVAAIISVVKNQRDDLLPKIRQLATQHDPIQQEACATALGALQDESSVPLLEQMTESLAPNVRLASLQALYRLGRKECRTHMEALAKRGDPFAITALSEMEGSEETLYALTKHPDAQVRVNATFALLERGDKRSFETLHEIMIRDTRDLIFQKSTSVGYSLFAYKVSGSATLNFADQPMAHELSRLIREEALSKALNISQEDFLPLAERLFAAQQNDLIPSLVHLLAHLQTKEAVALLIKEQQKAGAPLTRNYCNLALVQLKEEGPYEQNLKGWIEEQCTEELIRFRPILSREVNGANTPYQLTPEDTSSLLVESFETMAASQSDEAIDVLLHAIAHGNQSNKYALAGLLMRATH